MTRQPSCSFGANALVERPLSGLAELGPFSSAPQRLQTNMAEAIRLGMALFPGGSARRLVILSDGAATTGDTLQAAQLAAAAGITIDYVPLTRPAAPAEAMLDSGAGADTGPAGRAVCGERQRP
jgi:hypothetical protein